MQSYLDVSLMVVIGTAIVLLLFILISFIITSHRCSNLEKENTALKASLEDLSKNFTEQALKSNTAIENLERKVKASDMSLQYLTDAQQNLVDKQKVIDHSFDNLSVKIEQQKKEIQNNSVENQPIILAKRLLAEGLSINEVIAKTNLPSYEVEMLAKVHNLSNKARSVEEEVKAQAAVFANPTSISQAVEQNAQEPVQKTMTQPTHHVANNKARDAYGIGSKSSLRRLR